MAEAAVSEQTPRPKSRREPWYSVLYVQVLIAIAIGTLIGHFYPNFAGSSNRSAMRSSP